jgi:predicted TIM-barrel fold metal-dependent hydrolase
MSKNPHQFKPISDLQQGGATLSPLPCRIVSNEEFQPSPQSRRQALVEQLILEGSDKASRRHGMDRREFLRSTAGMALALAAMNAVFGRFFDVLDVEAMEPQAFAERKGERYFIVDLQTHYVSTHYDPTVAPGSATLRGEAFLGLRKKARTRGWNAELKEDTGTMEDLQWRNFVKEVFLDSETDLALISTPPGPYPQAAPVPPREMTHIRDEINRVTASQRMLAHGLLTPQLGSVDRDFMVQQAETMRVDAWKCYTGFPAKGYEHGWWMNDEKIAYPMLEHALKLKVPIVCVHKGLPLGPEEDYNHPRDLIKAAKDFPDIQFLVYHSGLFKGDTAAETFARTGEIPWTTEFCRMKAAEPSIRNIYMEIGNSFGQLVLSHPETCAHFLGQLLQTFGDDHVLWGTDSIWYGTPQWQIEAFRRFQIPEALMETYRYPSLTRQTRERIFGLNAARLFKVDVDAVRREVSSDALNHIKMTYLDEGAEPSHRFYGWVHKG